MIEQKPTLYGNPSPVVVIALAGKVGAGVSFVRDKILQVLKTYKYTTEIIDVSDVFLDRFYQDYSEDSGASSLENMTKAQRAKELQRRGNLLRKKFGPEFIARASFEDFIAQDLYESGRLIKSQGLRNR